VLVLGPNAGIEVPPVDGAMTVLASEPEMASLIACADAVLSSGGYNSVSEIRLAKIPSFFLPGRRPHDDQFERVESLARAGVAVVVDGEDAARAAEQVAEGCADAAALAAMRAAYDHDTFVPGNRAAAEAILACARR
jgi:predicted glycosyltransferase